MGCRISIAIHPEPQAPLEDSVEKPVEPVDNNPPDVDIYGPDEYKS